MSSPRCQRGWRTCHAWSCAASRAATSRSCRRSSPLRRRSRGSAWAATPSAPSRRRTGAPPGCGCCFLASTLASALGAAGWGASTCVVSMPHHDTAHGNPECGGRSRLRTLGGKSVAAAAGESFNCPDVRSARHRSRKWPRSSQCWARRWATHKLVWMCAPQGTNRGRGHATAGAGCAAGRRRLRRRVCFHLPRCAAPSELSPVVQFVKGWARWTSPPFDKPAFHRLRCPLNRICAGQSGACRAVQESPHL